MELLEVEVWTFLMARQHFIEGGGVALGDFWTFDLTVTKITVKLPCCPSFLLSFECALSHRLQLEVLFGM